MVRLSLLDKCLKDEINSRITINYTLPTGLKKSPLR